MNNSDDYLFLGNVSDHEIPNETEYLLKVRGPKYLPLTLVVPVTLAYVIIFVTGVIGNVATCIVIFRNPSMQTATNYYLFNLAVSDLLLLILGLPNELSVFWQQYPWKWGLGMCKLRAYISETSSYVSVLTIVAFSIERYLAIYHPLRYYGSGLKRSMRLILVAWLIAFIFAMPFAVYINVNYVEYPPRSKRYLEESAICAMQTGDIPKFPLYELSCIFFFLIPMVFIAVLYVRIGLRIQNDTLAQNVEGSVHGETRQAQSRRTITRMLSAVVITFFVCWAPFHVQRLLYVYQVSTFNDINQWLYPLGGCLYYFSATVNPILYNLMSAKYRNAFKETCYCASSSNQSISGLGPSSLRRSSTVYGARPRGESQVFPMKCIASDRIANDVHASARLQSDNGDGEKRRVAETNSSSTNDKNVDEMVENFVHEPRRSSFLVHAKNGRLRHQMSDKSETSSNETRI